jgi:hypothetical protein
MKNAFDELTDALDVGNRVLSLRPDQRRVIEAQLAEMTAPVPLMKAAPISRAPLIPPMKAPRAAPRPWADSKPWPDNSRALLAKSQELAAQSRRLAVRTRQMQAQAAHEACENVMQKAMHAFSEGRLTAHQVSVLETMTHRTHDMAHRLAAL